ncbi:MAG: hypothetical protein ACYCSQ_01695 [bacterium]
METAKLYFECEKCGQPFDIEINSGDFKCVKIYERETGQECIYEFKSKSYCCGKNIEIKIEIRQYPIGAYNRHNISYKGLRNLRTGDNFNNVINGVCQKYIAT